MACDDAFAVGELYEAYGRLIGHRYVLHERMAQTGDSSFSNISVLDACATRFQGGVLRFDMSANQDGLDLVILSFALSGQALYYRQNGVDCVALPGNAILHTTDVPLHAQADRAGEVMAVALPRAKLSAMLADRDALTTRVLPGDNPALSLFSGHARSFLSLSGLPDATLADLVGDQLCDLAAVALGANGTGKDKVMSGEAVTDVRFNRAIRYIHRHLADPTLGDADIARHLGLSVSSVRQIFARKQTTPARTIRKARVELAARLLRQTSHPPRKVLSIAFDCGFHSVSAFYDAFRDQYGLHPSDLRPLPRKSSLD
ncbi:hypothetical protein BJF92_09305 [Rhizobium rhizosphaerae]|uniref:HTH araC/xylS-type domain-containing protein n=2 Tax=Xaviernesmea rhizosphaerae TaxID=1672749 RepID=A0A1Q9AG94_9HYPH|nr:hypothetical protein BJF92_09305 [Xaviernesmea rhizosphaerae]